MLKTGRLVGAGVVRQIRGFQYPAPLGFRLCFLLTFEILCVGWSRPACIGFLVVHIWHRRLPPEGWALNKVCDVNFLVIINLPALGPNYIYTDLSYFLRDEIAQLVDILHTI